MLNANQCLLQLLFKARCFAQRENQLQQAGSTTLAGLSSAASAMPLFNKASESLISNKMITIAKVIFNLLNLKYVISV